MNSRTCNWILGVTAAFVLATSVAGDASAQYGGRSTGGNFDTPSDVRAPGRSYRAPIIRQAGAASNSADQYDPQVWLSGRRGWNSGVNQGSGVQSNAPGAVRQAAHFNQPYPIADDGMFVDEGMMMGPGPEEEIWGGQPPGTFHDGMGMGCSSCGEGGCGGGNCGASCGGNCGGSCGQCTQGCCMPCIFPDYFDVFAGVQGFKGPRDFGANGNFGFHEGFNAAGPLGFIPHTDLNYQVGWQALQSDLSGTVFQDDYRRQYFMTAGIFHYQECGLNYGAVWDWQRDNYYDDISLTQLRAQVSLRSPHGREIGFLAAIGTNDDQGTGLTTGGANPVVIVPGTIWEANDQFMAFYRWNFDCGGDFRIRGGFSGSKDGVFGADFHNPLSDCWSIYGGFTYLVPSEGNQGPGPLAYGAINENWNISLSLVYTFGKKAKYHGCGSPRPMFDVANNGSFLVQEQPIPDAQTLPNPNQ